MPLEDVLATQGDRPHKRRLHTQEPIRHILKLCEARASGQSSASKRGRQRTMSQMRTCQWSTVWPSRQQIEIALKNVDKELFDQHISPAVVTISDEEGEIDILARSGI